MSGTTGTVKKSTRPAAKKRERIEIGDEVGSTAGFVERVLLSTVVDLEQLDKTVERIRIQINTLVRETGVRIPKK